MLTTLLVVAFAPVLVVAAITGTVAHREHRRRALRKCPTCSSRSLVRALPQPPHDTRFYRDLAIVFRCTACGVQLFEPRRSCSVGPLTADQLATWIASRALPPARARFRTP